ncbi:MAG: efflux RND transporter periplasmic adaptor subunit [Methylococcales bacterium]|nr:efflux RND transporter periplasmic adaptor subunit [Methylococcales bacterium]
MQVVAVLALAVFPNAGTAADAAEPSGNVQAKSVAVAKVLRANLDRQIEIAAELLPFQEVDVQAKVAGYVNEINVDIGDRVKQGQVLATLEVPEIAEDAVRAKATVSRYRGQIVHERSMIRRYQAIAHQAEVTYQRLAAVNEESPNLIARQEIDIAASRAQASAAQVDAEQANLIIAQQQLAEAQASERRVQDMLNFARITAPFSGIVTKRYVDVGTMVQTSTSSNTQARPVVQVAEVDRLRLVFPVPESAMVSIKQGESAVVVVPALDKSFSATIWRFAGKADNKTRTMETQIKVDNQNFALEPGMVATVRLTLAHREQVLTVPLGAVSGNQTNASVLIVSPEHKIEERQVSLGMATATRYEVLSGLSENELVIVAGRDRIRVGQQVEPKLVILDKSSH